MQAFQDMGQQDFLFRERKRATDKSSIDLTTSISDFLLINYEPNNSIYGLERGSLNLQTHQITYKSDRSFCPILPTQSRKIIINAPQYISLCIFFKHYERSPLPGHSHLTPYQEPLHYYASKTNNRFNREIFNLSSTHQLKPITMPGFDHKAAIRIISMLKLKCQLLIFNFSLSYD